MQLRVGSERHRVWGEAAARNGVALSEFVHRAVEDRIAGRTTRAIARAVVTELLPELEQLVQGPLSPQSGQASPAAFVPAGPRVWDPSCYSADLHRFGVVCGECGGSFRARA